MPAALLLLRKFWYVIPLAGLLIFALFQKIELTRTKANLKAAETRVTDVTLANQSLNNGLSHVRLQRIDNDAIALAVAAKVGKNEVIETHTETVIEKAAKNDPVVKTWIDAPLPNSVRDALRAG